MATFINRLDGTQLNQFQYNVLNAAQKENYFSVEEQIAEKYKVVNFQNEEGFKNGFYVIEANTDNHVVWMSECFATEQEAINEMNSL